MNCPACSATGSIGLLRCRVCGGRGSLPDTRLYQASCPRCSATGMIGLVICDVCDGWGRLTPEEPQGLRVLHIEAGSAFETHLELSDIFQSLSSDVCVCDPYYGEGSLVRLAKFTGCSSVRFLTKHPDSREKAQLPRLIKEFVKTHGHVEIGLYPGNDIHDRYALSADEIILLGHGIKDAGAKESFVARLNRSIAGDMVESLQKAFDEKWIQATVIS